MLPSNFAVFNCCYFLREWLQRTETCRNCINQPSLLIFEPNWLIRLHLLWVNSSANEQKFKQRRHDESAYKPHTQENEKGATNKLEGVNWCDIHKEWLIKGVMFPVGTELNYVINN